VFDFGTAIVPDIQQKRWTILVDLPPDLADDPEGFQ
jgi:hypothetical protein